MTHHRPPRCLMSCQLFGLGNRLRRVEGGVPLRTEVGLIWIGLSEAERENRGYAFGKVQQKF
jgi:hypothetical protein